MQANVVLRQRDGTIRREAIDEMAAEWANSISAPVKVPMVARAEDLAQIPPVEVLMDRFNPKYRGLYPEQPCGFRLATFQRTRETIDELPVFQEEG